MSVGWQERFRTRVAMHDLAGAGEQLFGTPEAMLRNESARAAVVEAIDEALADGIPEAEIDAELAAYRAEQFDLERFVAVTAAVVTERERRYPEHRGRGWATLGDVARQAGLRGEELARARYEQALEQGLVRVVEVPETARGQAPTFAPARSGGGV